jgi:uncharacterized membrane protein
MKSRKQCSQAWWCVLTIPALGRLKQEDHEFEVSLGFIAKQTTKNQMPKQTKNTQKSFIIATNKINLGINLTKEVNEMCNENYKTLMKEIEGDIHTTNKQKNK